MQVIWKEKGVVVSIYGTRNDKNGFPMFLIKDGCQWIWRSVKHFEPFCPSKELK